MKIKFVVMFLLQKMGAMSGKLLKKVPIRLRTIFACYLCSLGLMLPLKMHNLLYLFSYSFIRNLFIQSKNSVWVIKKNTHGACFRLDIAKKTQLQIFLRQFYEPEVGLFITRQMNLRPGFFIDIGANVGYFTVQVATQFPRSKIFSFEPELENYNNLNANIQLNKLSNVKTYQIALSDTNERSDLYLNPLNDGGHSLSKFSHYSDNNRHYLKEDVLQIVGNDFPLSQKIELRKLSDFLPSLIQDGEICSVIKIDTEGHELRVLTGLVDILPYIGNPIIVCEISKNQFEISSLLEKYQYGIFALKSDGNIGDVTIVPNSLTAGNYILAKL